MVKTHSDFYEIINETVFHVWTSLVIVISFFSASWIFPSLSVLGKQCEDIQHLDNRPRLDTA